MFTSPKCSYAVGLFARSSPIFNAPLSNLHPPSHHAVRIDSWEAGSKYPNGHFVQQLGYVRRHCMLSSPCPASGIRILFGEVPGLTCIFVQHITCRINYVQSHHLLIPHSLIHLHRAIGDIETETASILVEHDISAPPFAPAQLAELPVDTPENPWIMVCVHSRSCRLIVFSCQ